MNTTEVLKLALDDLIAEYHMQYSSFARRVDDIFKEALAAPEDSSVVRSEEYKSAVEVSIIFHEGQRMFAVPKQPAPVQEPFAWCVDSENSADWAIAKTKEGVEVNAKLMDAECIKTVPFPLYTTPPAQPTTKDFSVVAAPVQVPVAHCEAGPEFCQQCHLEDRSLALAAAVRYVQNNTPKLVSDEICMALTTPPPAEFVCSTGLCHYKALPDAIHHTDLSEHPEYISGWNDYRKAMMEMMK